MIAPGDIVRARWFTKKTRLWEHPTPALAEQSVGIFNHGLVIAVTPALKHGNADVPVMVIDDTSMLFGWTYLSELSRLDPDGMVYF
jgi:hypothetical protein